MRYTQVAVYGSLKRGFGNHALLESARFLSTGWVDGFQMYSMGPFPMCIKAPGQVLVEVYLVSEAEFRRLDQLEGYPTFYDRSVVHVGKKLDDELAWMYHGNAEQVCDLPLVKSGVWAQEQRSHAFYS
jgi:gamma-glutamylcyclotransferase (GGCT)/AIG2-like uncharacterized protein YtfP